MTIPNGAIIAWCELSNHGPNYLSLMDIMHIIVVTNLAATYDAQMQIWVGASHIDMWNGDMTALLEI